MKTKTITVTMTLKEARSVEAHLKDLEGSRDEDRREPLKCVRDELDRLESARIRLTEKIDAIVKGNIQKLTHELSGCDAAAAMLLDEVQKIFHDKPIDAPPIDDWRLEFYIMEVMSSNMCSAFEMDRDKIEAIVNASCCGVSETRSHWNTAFRRLVRGGFLYSKRGNRVQFEPSRGKVTRYGLKLGKYDSKQVEA